jgi:uncharacterized protein (DUF433 family)
MERTGAYTADRAAALSGVPKSTIHYWARKGILVPSVSPEKLKLWSYTDLLGLRFIYWLRQPKKVGDGRDVPRTSMPAVRRALAVLSELDIELFEHGKPSIILDRSGQIALLSREATALTPDHQLVAHWVLDLIAPFSLVAGLKGPDLVRPSEYVRIVPTKLSGAPHIAETRVETQALYALEQRAFGVERIANLYPSIGRSAIEDALAVERQLAENLRLAA